MSLGEAIVVVDKVHEYVKSCSKKARELQYLKRETTDGPEGTLSSKCLKSLELMTQSLGKLQNNINESVFPSRFQNEPEFGSAVNT